MNNKPSRKSCKKSKSKPETRYNHVVHSDATEILRPPIEERAYLNMYPQICVMVAHLLSVATAGGMEEAHKAGLYSQIMDGLGGLRGDAFWPFRDEIMRLLVTPDEMYPQPAREGRND